MFERQDKLANMNLRICVYGNRIDTIKLGV